jgi:hypothetical protein
MLREQLPTALDRLETESVTLQQAATSRNQASNAVREATTPMQGTVKRLMAQSDADLNRLTNGYQKMMSRYGYRVSVLLVSQAILVAVTVLILWIR